MITINDAAMWSAGQISIVGTWSLGDGAVTTYLGPIVSSGYLLQSGYSGPHNFQVTNSQWKSDTFEINDGTQILSTVWGEGPYAGTTGLHITRQDGQPFSLISIDLDALEPSDMGGLLNFTGQTTAGQTVALEPSLDNTAGMQKFKLSGFTNLQSLNLVGPNFQFDNIVLSVSPTVSADSINVGVNQAVPGSSLITGISNPDGDLITAYEFIDYGNGGGHFVVNGVAQAYNTRIEILLSNLSTIQYVGGTSQGAETLGVAIYDSTTNSYSPYVSVTATTGSPSLAVLNTTTGRPVPATGQAYSGPVAGLQNQYINITTDSLNISTATPNWFIHSGAGNDALAVSSGSNVLDGGTGSNFLTGGSGPDTFFVDDRAAAADIWSTVNNFHLGDAATIWGVTPNDFLLAWVNDQGAAGYAGLTLHATAVGKPTASLTLVGYSQTDLNNGRLSVQFGSVGGSVYMYVHGNN